MPVLKKYRLMPQRAKSLKARILGIIRKLNLDLKGKVVLTEAASGAYGVTPLIASAAGAKVFAFAKTTRYGTAGTVVQSLKKQAKLFKNADITFIEKLSPSVLAQADIITNSGHLRPLNKAKLKYVKKGAVIPLMYEGWEFRGADLDLHYCHKRKIPVVATNERHRDVGVFDYLGALALLLIKDAGIQAAKSSVVLICNNDFGPYMAKVLRKQCRKFGVIGLKKHRPLYNKEEWLGVFPKINSDNRFADCRAVVFTAYPFDKVWIGRKATIKIAAIKTNFKKACLLRFAGDINEKQLAKAGVRYYPKNVPSGHMGILLSALGVEPILKLQAAGLKAGQAVLDGKSRCHGELIGNLL